MLPWIREYTLCTVQWVGINIFITNGNGNWHAHPYPCVASGKGSDYRGVHFFGNRQIDD